MPDILPNWHPAAVHFPIALSFTTTLLLLLGRLRPACASLLLGISAGSAVLAVALGWHAYLTVEHDAAGHLVMLRHRNWAMACTAGLLIIALWAARRQRSGKDATAILLPAMLLISGGLGFTAWLGGEMVYRHGVGVLPSAFSCPATALEPIPPAMPEAPATPAPASVPGEHVHQDGKRHRH